MAEGEIYVTFFGIENEGRLIKAFWYKKHREGKRVLLMISLNKKNEDRRELKGGIRPKLLIRKEIVIIAVMGSPLALTSFFFCQNFFIRSSCTIDSKLSSCTIDSKLSSYTIIPYVLMSSATTRLEVAWDPDTFSESSLGSGRLSGGWIKILQTLIRWIGC